MPAPGSLLAVDLMTSRQLFTHGLLLIDRLAPSYGLNVYERKHALANLRDILLELRIRGVQLELPMGG
jgi:hypothetical protein